MVLLTEKTCRPVILIPWRCLKSLYLGFHSITGGVPWGCAGSMITYPDDDDVRSGTHLKALEGHNKDHFLVSNRSTSFEMVVKVPQQFVHFQQFSVEVSNVIQDVWQWLVKMVVQELAETNQLSGTKGWCSSGDKSNKIPALDWRFDTADPSLTVSLPLAPTAQERVCVASGWMHLKRDSGAFSSKSLFTACVFVRGDDISLQEVAWLTPWCLHSTVHFGPL